MVERLLKPIRVINHQLPIDLDTYKRRYWSLFNRGPEVRTWFGTSACVEGPNYGDGNFCVHRASTIDLQKNVHRASTIEHPKFTVHRASNIRSSLCIGHRPPVIAFPRNQRNKKRLKQTSSFVKVKAHNKCNKNKTYLFSAKKKKLLRLIFRRKKII